MEFNIDDSIFDCLNKMNEKGLTHIGVMNNDRTQVQGFVNYNEITKFLVENYNGDISFFEMPLMNFDLTNH